VPGPARAACLTGPWLLMQQCSSTYPWTQKHPGMRLQRLMLCTLCAGLGDRVCAKLPGGVDTCLSHMPAFTVASDVCLHSACWLTICAVGLLCCAVLCCGCSMRLLRPQALVQEEAIRYWATTTAYRSARSSDVTVTGICPCIGVVCWHVVSAVQHELTPNTPPNHVSLTSVE
jgi:hypothetical protein